MVLSLKLPRTCGIYGLKNKVNGKIYVGSAVNLHKRRKEHHTDLTNLDHPNDHLQKSWNKYGPEAFEFVVLELVEHECDLITTEQTHIDIHFGDNCYNICPTAGSCLGRKDKPETIQRKRELMFRPDMRIKMDRTGYNHTDDVKALIGDSNRKNPRIKTEVSKDKLRNASYTKPVIQMSMDGSVVGRFRSSAHAEQVLGIKHLATWITRCCKGTQAFAKGFKWRYE